MRRMSSPLRRATALASLSCLGVAVIGSSAFAAQQPTETGASVKKTRVCVIKKTKRARVVRTTETCVRGETRMTWKRYQDFANSSASSTDNSAGSSDTTGPAGPAGPQGLTGETGARGAGGPAGATGATGAKGTAGETGATGATGATGERGAGGPAGPSDIFTTTGSSGLTTTSEDTRATLTLPAGAYLLIGQANAFSSSTTGQFLVRCRLRDRGTQVSESSGSINDATADSPSTPADAANLIMTTPLFTAGGTVTLNCQGIFGLPLISGVQLTAIKTGALHVQ
ncbi:MAG: collagen-like protein [Solirubrobacterales bacterium]|nr:collagen-like protein [Solirubrobacterales bacterium]